MNLNQLVMYWIIIKIVLQTPTQEKIPTYSERNVPTFIKNVTFVATTQLTSSNAMSIERMSNGADGGLQSSFPEQLESTSAIKEAKTKESMTGSDADSDFRSVLNYTSNENETRMLLDRDYMTPHSNSNQNCSKSEYTHLSVSVENPCGRTSTDININYLCDISCSEEENKSCKFVDCNVRFQCKTGTYIPVLNQCDGAKNCHDNEDEKYCMGATGDYCTCIGVTINCSHMSTGQHKMKFSTDSTLVSVPNLAGFSPINSLSYILMLHCSLEQLPYVFKWCQIGGCSDLEHIVVSDSELWSYESIFFVPGISKLQARTLSKGRFSHARASEGLPLYNLDLSSNEISFLPVGVFDGLPLHTIDLSFNKLASLFQGLLNGLPLQRINLSYNRISSLPVGVFNGLRLHYLNLSSNRIASLSIGIFNGMSLHDLDLSSNRIASLPAGVFKGLPLNQLNLSFNTIASLPVGVFKGLPLDRLDLSSNRIASLTAGVFKGLFLNRLDLSSNRIASLPVGLFNGLFIYDLDLSSNRIASLSISVFNGLSLPKLDLSSNRIASLPVGVFNGLQLYDLDLSSNRITSLPVGIFNGLQLYDLDLSSNGIASLPVGIFNGMPLYGLDLASNRIASLPVGVFNGLVLDHLDLSSNRIAFLPVGIFNGLFLNRLDLSSNRIASLLVGGFNGLSLYFKTTIVNLSSNKISFISEDMFNGLQLNNLDLSSNRLSYLSRGMLRGLHCKYINLANNELIHILKGSFEGVEFLEFLILDQNKLEIAENIFENLKHLTHLVVDTYMLCCVKPKTVQYGNCLAKSDNRSCIKQKPNGYVYMGEDCSAPTNAISSCTALIGSGVLQTFLWIIGVVSLIGNISVIMYRLVSDKETLKKSYSVFVLNLSLSDVLMGVYMVIIGYADVKYRGVYAWNDQKWRRSTLCITAGILSTISSEMSIFVILLISIDRFIVIVFPFTRHRISWRLSIFVSVTLWAVAVILAIIPEVTFHSYFKSGFYSKSGVCLALPLADDTDGVEYSILVFVGLNSCIFIVIMVLHFGIYRSISRSAVTNTQTRRRDIAVAKTLFLVVATDFCCWIPIGIMGILAQTGLRTPDDIYSWVMIFVLPINSAINPFIYTFIYVWRKWRRRLRRTQMELSMTPSPRRQDTISAATVNVVQK